MRLDDLSIKTNADFISDPELLTYFVAHDRVIHDPKTDLYSYRVSPLAPHSSSYDADSPYSLAGL